MGIVKDLDCFELRYCFDLSFEVFAGDFPRQTQLEVVFGKFVVELAIGFDLRLGFVVAVECKEGLGRPQFVLRNDQFLDLRPFELGERFLCDLLDQRTGLHRSS